MQCLDSLERYRRWWPKSGLLNVAKREGRTLAGFFLGKITVIIKDHTDCQNHRSAPSRKMKKPQGLLISPSPPGAEATFNTMTLLSAPKSTTVPEHTAVLTKLQRSSHCNYTTLSWDLKMKRQIGTTFDNSNITVSQRSAWPIVTA